MDEELGGNKESVNKRLGTIRIAKEQHTEALRGYQVAAEGMKSQRDEANRLRVQKVILPWKDRESRERQGKTVSLRATKLCSLHCTLKIDRGILDQIALLDL